MIRTSLVSCIMLLISLVVFAQSDQEILGTVRAIGFLTRVADEDFCASTIPSDWEPLEFNGHTYYVQPLSEDVEGS